MAASFEGLWQLDLLNGAPDVESNQYTLHDGKIASPEGDPVGTYHVAKANLVLLIAMSTAGEEEGWSIRATLPLRGPLAGEHMLGVIDAIFSEGDPLAVSECAFYRVRADV